MLTTNQIINNFESRVKWIDSLRTIGIFFVVLIHTGRVDYEELSFFTSFFLQLFFFISGLFFRESNLKKSFNKYLVERMQRLLIPYLVFCSISYLIWLLVIRNFQDKDISPWKLLLGIIYGSGSGGWLSFNISLWFFTCLFMTQILLFIILKKIKSNKKIALVLFFLSILGNIVAWLVSPNIGLPWNLHIVPTATVFYGIGYLCQSYVLTEKLVNWHRWLVVSLLAILYLVFTPLNGKVVFVTGLYGNNYIYFYIASLSAILFWTHICRLLPTNWLVAKIGSNTLTIFSLHLLIFPFLTGFLVYVLNIPKVQLDSGIYVALGYTFIAISILLPVGEAINRWIPFIIGKSSRTGTQKELTLLLTEVYRSTKLTQTYSKA